VELQDSYRIAYRFSFPDGSRKEFDLDLDPRTIVFRTDTNALLVLHSLAQLLTGEMNSDLGSIRYLFAGDDGPEGSGRGLDA
jgi:hypothetical protein